MLLLQAALLGVVQGLTEFLPVSSSAHLILARAFFGWEGERFGLPFDVACHVGTLGAILLYFRRDLVAMAGSVPRLFGPAVDRPTRLLWLVLVGTIPVVLVGGLAVDVIDRLRSPVVIVVTLAVVALLMLAAERAGRRTRDEESLTVREALVIGAAQATALVPGVSRSGATITTALFLGLRRDAGARFSFLLGVPAMVAAAAHEALGLTGHPTDALTVQVFLVGMVSSGVVGYATVKYFIRFLAGHTLDAFAVYRLVLAAVTLAWLVGG
ncbi:MAG TPA: undecaprenyl-diphosphatase UppP [Methylomirabilota bacterium]